MEATLDINIDDVRNRCLDEIRHLTDASMILKIADLIAKTLNPNYVDPYLVSPSGDPYWSDKRNVKDLEKALEDSKDPQNIAATIKPGASVDDFLAAL